MKLDQRHKLYKLSSMINWDSLEAELRQSFTVCGRYPCRFVVGILYLKSINQLDVYKAIEQWECDPYWRYFCGVMPTQQEEPFPYATHLVDIWDREFAGDGYDIMIRALMRSMSKLRKPGEAADRSKSPNVPWFSRVQTGVGSNSVLV